MPPIEQQGNSDTHDEELQASPARQFRANARLIANSNV
jgi:hypothetical protein